MCLATPLKIIEINDQQGTVGDKKHTHQVDLSLIDSPQVGEWVICHGDLALNRIGEKEAGEILALQTP